MMGTLPSSEGHMRMYDVRPVEPNMVLKRNAGAAHIQVWVKWKDVEDGKSSCSR
jgi:hypothetical protein